MFHGWFQAALEDTQLESGYERFEKRFGNRVANEKIEVDVRAGDRLGNHPPPHGLDYYILRFSMVYEMMRGRELLSGQILLSSSSQSSTSPKEKKRDLGSTRAQTCDN